MKRAARTAAASPSVWFLAGFGLLIVGAALIIKANPLAGLGLLLVSVILLLGAAAKPEPVRPDVRKGEVRHE